MTHTPDSKSEQKVARTEKNEDFTFLDYHHLTVLLPRPAIKYRGCPLDQTTFNQSIDKDGQILNVDYIKNYIFFGVR